MKELCKPQNPESQLPHRVQIVKMLEKKKMKAAEVAAHLGWTREKAYNILNKMERAGLIGKFSRSNQAYWGKKPPKPEPIQREPRVHAGTMTERLSLSYMNTPARPGSMDAYAIKSRGIGA